jgi:hypothetical protein
VSALVRVVGKPVPFFANIPQNSGLHLLPIPFTKQFADYYTLGELKVYGVAADVAMARTWYERAKEFGSKEAPHLLEILASATR